MPTLIIAIDAGNTTSGYVELDGDRPIDFDGAMPNETVLVRLRSRIGQSKPPILVLETFRPRGQPLYWQLIWTAIWIGRFIEAWSFGHGEYAILYREAIKLHVLGRAGGDSNIRAALIDRYGGKERAIGSKAEPGPLYGMSRDAWQALAVGLTYLDGVRCDLPHDKK